MEIKEQVTVESADPELLSAPEQQTIVTELTPEGAVKLEVIQSLLEPCDRVTYGQRLLTFHVKSEAKAEKGS